MKRSLANLCRTRSAQPRPTSFEWHKEVIYFGLATLREPDHAGRDDLVAGVSAGTDSCKRRSSSSCMKNRTKSQRRERAAAGSRSRNDSKK
jgi:hypothetical protein